MKTVRTENGVVVEIIPEDAHPVEKWYGALFASKCVEAPDEVEQDWAYNPTSGVFSAPSNPSIAPEPDLQADIAELLIDLAYRTTLLELGVSI